MSENEIPASWIEVKLGDVCFTTSGGTPSRKREDFYIGSIPWVKSGELEKGIIYCTEECISESAVQHSSAKIFPAGTLLIALYGATIGKLGFLGVDAATNQAVCGIFKNEVVDLNYLNHFLFFNRNKLIEQGAGGAQPNISQAILKDLPLIIPPFKEQSRIVARIEELFSELDKGIETLKRAQQQLKVYRQAVLKYAFEGKLTNPDVKVGELPKGWDYCILKDLTTKIVDGTHHTPTYVSDGVHFISVKDINDYKIDFSKTKFISNDEHLVLKNRCNPEEGDILITKSGTIGRLSIVPPRPEFSLFVSVALLKIRKDLLKSKYALYALQNHVNHLNIEKDIKGGLLKNYHLEDLRKATIMYVPLEQQDQIVQEIESRLSVCDKIEESLEQSLQQAEALRQSILKKAFEGKLVPQDSNDEPASELLDRIKAEGESAQPEKKTRSKKAKA